jgi:RNA polymerase sigma-70 factor, ECF subfamily
MARGPNNWQSQRIPTLTHHSDRDDFLSLVEDHGSVVFALLRRLCGNVPDAEDVFQETAVRVWRSFAMRPKLRNRRAWLMTVAYRAFVDLRRRPRQPDELYDLTDTRSEGPGETAVRVEESQRVGTAVEQLSDTLRQVVVLHYTGGLTLQETANLLGVSAGTVKSRLSAALTKLRSFLE